MRDKHEPRGEFVERLERQILERARQGYRQPGAARWIPQSPIRALAAAAALAIVSMGIGGGAVAAAFQAQTNEQRALLSRSYEQKIHLAELRLNLAKEELQTAQRRVSVGIADDEALSESQSKVIEAEARLQIARLQLEEVRATGQEPVNLISAPVVSGRDFVTQRLEAELSIPMAALDVEKRRLSKEQRRFELGLANQVEVQKIEAQVREIDLAIMSIRRKIDVRRQFLAKELDAILAELEILLAEAKQAYDAATTRLELAKRDLSLTQSRFEKGLVQEIDLKRARLNITVLEVERLSRELEVSSVQTRIRQRRGK